MPVGAALPYAASPDLPSEPELRGTPPLGLSGDLLGHRRKGRLKPTPHSPSEQATHRAAERQPFGELRALLAWLDHMLSGHSSSGPVRLADPQAGRLDASDRPRNTQGRDSRDTPRLADECAAFSKLPLQAGSLDYIPVSPSCDIHPRRPGVLGFGARHRRAGAGDHAEHTNGYERAEAAPLGRPQRHLLLDLRGRPDGRESCGAKLVSVTRATIMRN